MHGQMESHKRDTRRTRLALDDAFMSIIMIDRVLLVVDTLPFPVKNQGLMEMVVRQY